MNQKLKYVGLLAILPLLTVALSSAYLTDAEAVGGLGVGEAEERLKVSEPTPVELSLVQIGEPSSASAAQKSYKGFHEEQYDTTQTFRAIYKVQNAADSDVKNIQILLTSDTETVQTKLLGKLDPKHSIVVAMIKALDPDTISAKIISWDL